MPKSSEPRPGGILRGAYHTGLGLAISSYLAYLVLPAVPFLPFGRPAKTAIGGGLLVMHQFMLWGGVALAGPEALKRVEHLVHRWTPWGRRRPPSDEPPASQGPA